MIAHEDLLEFDIYRGAHHESQVMFLWLANHIETKYGVRPFATGNGFLQWKPNFALVQTLGVRTPNLTINLSGRQDRYRGIGVDHLFSKPWRGLTRLRLLESTGMPELLAAVDHSYRIKGSKGARATIVDAASA